MTGYIRKDTTNNIADGNVINATDLDNEFDGVQAAFVVATGHTHDGTANEGAAITKIGPVQDVVVSIAAMYPKITNTVDLGTSSLKYKDAFFAGNETVGGTLAVTGVATLTAQPVLSSLTASQAVFTDASKGLVSNAITGTGNVVMSTSPTLVTPILGTPASGTVTNLTGTASININGTVGATTANTGAFTTLTTSSTVTLNGGTANGVSYLNGSKQVTTGSALTFDGADLEIGVNGSFKSAFAGNGLVVSKFNVGPVNAIRSISNTSDVLLINDSASGFANTAFYASGTEGMRLTSSGLEVKQSQLIGYSSYAGLGSYGLAVAGNVGIGTSSPQRKFSIANGGPVVEIDPAGIGSANPIYFNYNRTTSVYTTPQYWALAHNWMVGGGTSAMLLDSSGNLGLGVTPSANWAASTKAFQFGQVGNLSSAQTGSDFVRLSYNDTDTKYRQTDVASRYNQSGGVHSWLNAPSGTAGAAITFTQAMTLNASGNLGIGTTSPAGKLEVNGTVRLGSLDINLTTANAAVWVSGSDFGVGTFYGNALKFLTSNVERARIDASGNLLVGTTSVNPAAGVAVNNPSTAPNIRMSHETGTASGAFFMEFNYNQSGCGSITQLGTSAVLYNTSSDYRLKNITGPITTSGAYIDSLKPVEGTWKADGSAFVGLIAHETQEASRTTVATGTKDGEQMQGMDYSSAEIIANLIAEIQDLRKRLAAAGI